MSKAQRLFNGLTRQIRLRREILDPEDSYHTAEDAFKRWSDPKAFLSCQDYAFLYVSLARQLGLKANFVLINKDCWGAHTCHACAGVFINEKALLADPAYLWFGAPHKEYQFLDDVQTLALHLSQQSAIRERKTAVKLAPELAITHLNLAEILARHDQSSEAWQELRAGIELDSGKWLGLYVQALIESYGKDWEMATQHLRECLDLNPAYQPAHFLFATILQTRGKKSESLREFRTYLEGDTTPEKARIARKAIAGLSATLSAAE